MDAIVLGLGGMGSAAAYHLAARGVNVRGFEQFWLGHNRGSSHGQTRIIRTAYYEHPGYIPLVQRAFELWRDLESITGRQLLTPCDCLSLGPADGAMIAGVSRAAAMLPPGSVKNLTAREVQAAYPFRMPESFAGRLESEAGMLRVEACVQAHLDAARTRGAKLHESEAVLSWKSTRSHVEVTTNLATYRADKLIITAGAWASSLLTDLGVPLTVMRQTMLWFAPLAGANCTRDRFPVFMMETPHGDFYGLPSVDERGVKLARHYGEAEEAHPDAIDWTLHERDREPVQQFIDQYLPNTLGGFNVGRVCMYTLTPDRHFVLDRHPNHANVCVAAGFSGHGFKFASVVGETLADLATRKPPTLPIEMFSAKRFPVQ